MNLRESEYLVTFYFYSKQTCREKTKFTTAIFYFSSHVKVFPQKFNTNFHVNIFICLCKKCIFKTNLPLLRLISILNTKLFFIRFSEFIISKKKASFIKSMKIVCFKSNMSNLTIIYNNFFFQNGIKIEARYFLFLLDYYYVYQT